MYEEFFECQYRIEHLESLLRGNTRSNMSFIHVRAYMFVKHERPCVGPKTLQTCTRIQKVRQTSQPGFA
jgi:hypothetical protein